MWIRILRYNGIFLDGMVTMGLQGWNCPRYNLVMLLKIDTVHTVVTPQ